MRAVKYLLFLSFALLFVNIANAVTEPIAQWSMDDEFGYVTDSSDNQYSGILEGVYEDAVFSSTAKIGSGSLQCTASDGTRMNGGIYPGSASSMTLAFWAKADTVIYSSPVGKHPIDASGKGWKVMFRNNGDIWFLIGSSTSYNVNCRATAAYSADTWVHVTCTFSSGTAKIYIDGVLQDTETSITQTINDTASDLCVGHVIGEGSAYTFDGLIDEVRIYDSVLTDTEIEDLADEDYYDTENQAPLVEAGPGHTIWSPDNSISLDATITDDGLPASPGSVSSTWSKDSGPSTVTFGNANAVDTTATFGATGTYVLKLTATDGDRTRTDYATVEVFAAATNKAPHAYAGPDESIWLPQDTLKLAGEVFDDDVSGTLSMTWSKVSGPGTVTFTSTSIVDPNATFSTDGEYVLQLAASDGTLSYTDTVDVIVYDPDATNDVVGWWKMDGNGDDSSGNDYDGTLENSASYSTSYKIGTGSLESTDSTGSRLNCGTTPGSAEALTVVFWAKPSKLDHSDVVGKFPYRNASNDNGWRVLNRDDGDWWFCIGGPAGSTTIEADVAASANVWTHIACTFDSGTAKIYVNGQLENTTTGIAYDVDDTVTDLQIGHIDGLGYGYTFPGLIDEVAIYDIALTDDAIEDIYDNGVQMSINSAPDPYDNDYGYSAEEFEENFAYELTVDYDTTGQASATTAAPPDSYVHPRIFFGPEDLDGIRQRLLTTNVGRQQMYKLETEIIANLTGSNATHRDVYDDLIDGDPNSYLDLYDTGWVFARPVVEMMMKEAFRCLMEVDVLAAQDMADATETLADIMQEQLDTVNPTTDWRATVTLIVIQDFTAMLYDYIYPWMSETQRSKVREVLADATAGKWGLGMGALNAPPAHTSNWFCWSTGELMVSSLAIEGETGYDAEVYNQIAEAYKGFVTFGFYPNSGAPFEPIGKNALTTQNLIAISKRGENLVASWAARNHIENFYIYAMMPWGYGWTWFDDWGGPDLAARVTDVAAMKHAFPDSDVTDFVWRNVTDEDYSGLDTNSTGYGEALLTAAFAHDWDDTQTWSQALDDAVGSWPLTFFCEDSGRVIARSSWDSDAVQMHFKVGSVPGGHTHADRGVFTVNALGRVWGSYPHSSSEQYSKYHSVVLIDGVGQGYMHASPGIMLDFVDTDVATFATGDEYWAYTKKFGDNNGTLMDLSWNDFRYDPTDPNEPWMNLPWSDLPDWYSSEKSNKKWGDWNPVERAYRTAGLIKGQYPWVLIVDDIEKDDSSHVYKWLMRLPDDLVSNVSISGGDATLTDPDDSTLKCLVRVLEANGTAVWSVNSTNKTLELTTTTIAPDFKIMIFPYFSSEPSPSTTWSNDNLTVTIGNQTDVLNFSVDAYGLTSVTMPAVANLWDDGAADSLWSSESNWGNDRLPRTVDDAWIDATDDYVLISSGVNALAANCIVARNNTKTDITLEMTGGTLTTTGVLFMGQYAGSEGTMELSGGTVNVGTEMGVAVNGEGTFTMTGGSLNVTTNLKVGRYNNATAVGHLDLDAGTITCNDFYINDYSTVDIQAGTLIIDGDESTEMNTYVTNGDLTAFDGSGTVNVDYNVTNAGKTTVTASINRAWDDGAADSLWSSSANWSNDTLPRILDGAWIDTTDDYILISSGINAQADHCIVARNNTKTDITLEMTGGTLTTTGVLFMGQYAGSEGTMELSGGTVNVGTEMGVAVNGEGTFTMTGGSLNVTTNLKVGRYNNATAVGHLDLDGGTITCNDFYINDYSTTDIQAGTLIIDGNESTEMNTYVTDGVLTAYDGTGRVNVDYNVTNAGKTTVTASSSLELGNTAVSATADSWISNMVINETDTYTNSSGSSQTIEVDEFEFYARALNDPVTPFIVKVNGDNSFTVVAVGTTRTSSNYSVGANTFDFYTGTAKTFSLANGETIAIGFLDANADGTGTGNGSVIPFNTTSPADEIWYTGNSGTGSGSVSEGSAPTAGTSTLTTLSRSYSFNITFLVQ